MKKRLFSILFSLFYIFSVCNIVYATYADEQWQWIDGVKQERCTYRAWHEAYDRLGISLPTNWGNAGTWADNARNAGYSVDNNPTANSIVCWSGGGYGHVAYVTGVDNTYIYIREGGINPSNSYPAYWYRDDKYLKSNQNRWSGFSLKGYIHLRSNDTESPTITADLGTNFYAYIINTSAWKHLTYDSDWNVTIRTETGKSNQIWCFVRLNDGSYKITSVKDGKCFEVHNFETANGTNVHMNDYNGNTAQQWYISGESSKYVLKAKCSDNVLDVAGGGTSDGTNVQMWEYNGTSAQLFQIWELTPPEIKKPSLKVTVTETSNPNVKFTWGSIQNADSYDIRISQNGKVINTIWSQTGTSCTVNLYPGSYTANIAAVNNNFVNFTFSDEISFTVKNTYTVSFDANGGSTQTASKTVTYDSTYGELPYPTKNGYEFLGWFTENDDRITENSIVDINEDITLYAKWKKTSHTLSTVTKDDALTVSTNLINITSGKIIVAGYNDNKVIDFAIKDYSVDKEIFVLNGNIDKVKVMVWDGLDSLKPLTETEVIPQSKWILN